MREKAVLEPMGLAVTDAVTEGRAADRHHP
jgi:hypothetical protein